MSRSWAVSKAVMPTQPSGGRGWPPPSPGSISPDHHLFGDNSQAGYVSFWLLKPKPEPFGGVAVDLQHAGPQFSLALFWLGSTEAFSSKPMVAEESGAAWSLEQD